MRKQTARWKQKDGTFIRICDMTDTHLRNTIAMLERATERYDIAFAIAPNPFRGDLAFDRMESAQDAILEGEAKTDPSDLYPIYAKLCAERNRRASNDGSEARL